ncbi:MAG TPA: hypothetical protein VFQ12_10975 [Thermoleophilaceae bacterium]|nr:hypothetical protein [Thermoleophilaceae bacterium]
MRWAAICALALLPGCSLGGDEEPVRAGGAPREIAALVRQLELATQHGDAGAVCDDLLTSAARARMGGSECSRRVRRGLAGLRDPQLGLLGIRLLGDGSRAAARLRTEVARRRPLEETLELRRVDGEWRLEAR